MEHNEASIGVRLLGGLKKRFKSELMVSFTSSLKQEFILFVDALRAGCLSMVPYLVVVAVLTVVQDVVGIELSSSGTGAENLVSALQSLFPMILVISLSYHYSNRHDVGRNIGVLLGLIAPISSYILFSKPNAPDSKSILFSNDLMHTLVLPLLTIRLLASLDTLIRKLDKKSKSAVSNPLADSVHLIVPFVLSLLIALAISYAAIPFTKSISQTTQAGLNGISDTGFMFARMILSHLLWMFGLHGDNLLGLMYDTRVLFLPISGDLNYIGFYNLFVLHGGCGAALCLWIAVLLFSNDGHGRRVALLATPFIIFNIPEILIFGLPLIMNRHLIFPFILVPAINFIVAICAVQTNLLHFANPAPPWTTPVFLNAYLATGDPWGVIIQALCIVLGVMVYSPFVRKFSASQSSSSQMRRLEQTLNISSALQAGSGLKFHAVQAAIIDSHAQVDKVIRLLEQNDLEVHYQPKVDITQGHCNQYEALLRLRMRDGSLKGPVFLDTLEMAGMASTIDLWVCRAVKQDLLQWAHNFNAKPRIAINLHPETIKVRSIIEKIAEELRGEPVDFEIIERGDATEKNCLANLKYLQSFGFRIALDDFGTGHAGLSPLNLLPINVIKLDKTLLDAANNESGLAIYQSAVTMCKNLGFECVAEGVETKEQLAMISKSGVNYVQGFLLSKALPASHVMTFLAPKFD